MATVTPLVVPQVNVNDETVRLECWSVPDGATVAAGDAVCDVETTKAASEITTDAAGVLVQSATAGDQVRVGAVIGAIGPTREAAAAFLAERVTATRPVAGSGATPKAAALAAQHGVSLDQVRAAGVQGTIKETDVRRFIDASAALPAGLDKYLFLEGALPGFDAAIAANLRRSTQGLILTSVDMDCRLGATHAVVKEAQAAGRMVSLLHLVIAAVGRALPSFPRLTSFVWEGSLYRHTAVDIAFVARAADGKLFTPVLRAVDQLSLADIAKASQAAALRAMRGTARVEDFEGAAFTISQVPVPGTTRVAALPSFGQSAILGVSSERMAVGWVDGVAVPQPMVTFTLSYDHALCDGVYAASFLAALVKDLESPRS
ncbi:MAG: 2-oxo acid dehydrogenase subunit E2 [Acidobacteriota bacterium]|nr:2-oxo acid dehydrogenase subunit E2 [Acidobacteriota bacterium]